MIKRGEVYYVDLSPVVGSEQGGRRPCLVVQNDVGNKFSPCTIVAIITSRTTKAKLPTQCWISKSCGLSVESMVECEQLRTIDKSRLKQKLGEITKEEQKAIDKCLRISVGI